VRYLFEDFVLDIGRRELRRGATAVPVAPQVFDLLEYLVRHRERVVSKDDLIAAVWEQRIVSDAALTTRINVARSAIADSGEEQRLIKTLPRKGFRFVGAVREEPGTVGEASVETPRAIKPPDKPSVAVLPFANLSADLEQEYVADGVVEDIITALSRFSELFVIARNSSFQYKGRAVDVRVVGRELGVRYLVEGSIRRSGNRLRVAAQLIDAESGTHRWAENYDRTLDDVFDVQDAVARTIATILTAHVRKAETERARAKPPASWQSYDCYLQASEALDRFTFRSFDVKDIYEARRLIEQSLAIDPLYARSYALLAETYNTTWVIRLDDDHLNPAALERALQLARKAVELDPLLPEAHAALGSVLTWLHEHDASVAAFERASALNPNYADWRFGWALVPAGDSRRAIEVLKASMRLDPFHGPLLLFYLGVAHFMLKEYTHALAIMRDFVAQAPVRPWGHAMLAAIFAQLGREEEANTETAETLRLDSSFTVSGTAKSLAAFKHPKDDEHFLGALRRAGFPEPESLVDPT
jgi:adenylate cyclase